MPCRTSSVSRTNPTRPSSQSNAPHSKHSRVRSDATPTGRRRDPVAQLGMMTQLDHRAAARSICTQTANASRSHRASHRHERSHDPTGRIVTALSYQHRTGPDDPNVRKAGTKTTRRVPANGTQQSPHLMRRSPTRRSGNRSPAAKLPWRSECPRSGHQTARAGRETASSRNSTNYKR